MKTKVNANLVEPGVSADLVSLEQRRDGTGTLEEIAIQEDRVGEKWPVGQEVSGAELYRDTLEMLGVKDAFVYTGGRVLSLLDKLGESETIRLIKGPHEQDLGHTTQAYFRVTKQPGWLFTTSGPGGTNAATPVKDAHSDSDALILTVGQVPVEAIKVGDEAFQGALMVEPYSYWAKWTYRITDINEVQSVVKTAYELSKSGRPGPVVIEFPSDIQTQKAELKPLEEVQTIVPELKTPRVYGMVDVKSSTLGELVEAFQKSERPVLYAGGGIYSAGASQELVKFAELTDTPIVTTLMLLGAVPKHELNLGMPGMHGHPENNLAIHNSDLVVGIGTRLDDRIVGDSSRFAPYADIFWIEINHPGIGGVIASRVKKIEADAKNALEYLIANSEPMRHESWTKQINAWREKYPMPMSVHREVIGQVRKNVNRYEQKEPYVTTGVGAHQMFVAQYWDFNPEPGRKMLLTSGGLGPMGSGTPFGVGVLIVDPERPVYVFNGDGSAAMDQRSLWGPWKLKKDGHLKNHGLKEIVFRNDSLGMVDHWQNLFYGGRKVATELEYPPAYFQKMAEQHEFAYFAVDYTNGNRAGNPAVIEEFVKYRGNALLEVRVRPEPPFPMIPSGRSVAEMVLHNGVKLDPYDLTIGAPKNRR